VCQLRIKKINCVRKIHQRFGTKRFQVLEIQLSKRRIVQRSKARVLHISRRMIRASSLCSKMTQMRMLLAIMELLEFLNKLLKIRNFKNLTQLILRNLNSKRPRN
jgi:hypothetical protein